MKARVTRNNLKGNTMAIKVHLCPRYEYAMSLLGKRWSGLIIKALMEGPLRFNELLCIVRVSDRVLTERLRELEAVGLVERTVFPESPVRIEYSLTPKGRAMDKVMEAVQTWAENWVTPEEIAHIEATEKADKKSVATV
jgi:DNA-binding HxlR family transcriptional regulator